MHIASIGSFATRRTAHHVLFHLRSQIFSATPCPYPLCMHTDNKGIPLLITERSLSYRHNWKCS